MKLAPLALLAVLAACQTTPADPDTARREACLEAHPETGPEVASAIRAGKIRGGMLFREVEASLGTPLGEPIRFSCKPSSPRNSWLADWGCVVLQFSGSTLETTSLQLHTWLGVEYPPGLVVP
ncbi:MAG: hypothetical protein JRF61_09805 [Deltaproteobacteria bacterium]|jgi:hypothetical protein|nr:hypothetical protein [Deltaproteobacteria bacterium]